MKKTKKPKSITDIDKLYKAVQAYVENRGGKLIVIGGIEIQKRPMDNEFVFRVAVKCMGKQPLPLTEKS